MFPAGAPGVGLLLLRIGVGVLLLLKAFPDGDVTDPWWAVMGLVILAGALCIGIYTPVTCAISVLVQAAGFSSTRGESVGQLVCLVFISISIGLLGPGAFSVDALLFGRRLVPPANEL
jgi:hypothetical protein